MSSLFVEAEEQLSTLALKRLRSNGHDQQLDVVVGGLGTRLHSADGIAGYRRREASHY